MAWKVNMDYYLKEYFFEVRKEALVYHWSQVEDLNFGYGRLHWKANSEDPEAIAIDHALDLLSDVPFHIISFLSKS